MNQNDPGNRKPKSWPRRHPILTTVLVGFVVVIVASALGNANRTTTPSGTTQVVSSGGTLPAAPTVIRVTTMADEFEANQIAAERKWGGQYIQFTAPVSNITSSGVAFYNVTTRFSFTQVKCDFKDENVLATLAKGRPATVRGVVSDDQILGVISLRQCQVVR